MRCLRHCSVNYRVHSVFNVARPRLQHVTISQINRRGIIDVVHPAAVPPLVFCGLVVCLWTWKCMMMVLFQNKIIYMPGLPPNTRRERIPDYASQCSGITWREERTTSSDGTEIGMCVSEVESSGKLQESTSLQTIYIVYFQGNASSLPPRLPFLSQVLRRLKEDQRPFPVRYIMVCVSYRGFWTSKGRPSERGIAKDAVAALRWVSFHSPNQASISDKYVPTILWGQSIGAGVATTLAASTGIPPNIDIRKLILETPFTSVRDMLVAIYPQKWLPYRYLWPFLWNHLDSYAALEKISQRKDIGSLPDIVIAEAGDDEIIPRTHGATLDRRAIELGFHVRHHTIKGALHTEVLVRPQGCNVVANAIKSAVS